MNGFPYFIPTIDEPMSTYTAMVFGFIFAITPFACGLLYYWGKREITRINKTMDAHNEYIETTSSVIGELHTDIAVIKERVGGTQEDMTNVKDSLAGINKTLWEQFVK